MKPLKQQYNTSCDLWANSLCVSTLKRPILNNNYTSYYFHHWPWDPRSRSWLQYIFLTPRSVKNDFSRHLEHFQTLTLTLTSLPWGWPLNVTGSYTNGQDPSTSLAPYFSHFKAWAWYIRSQMKRQILTREACKWFLEAFWAFSKFDLDLLTLSVTFQGHKLIFPRYPSTSLTP